MTSQNALQTEQEAFQRSVFAKSLERILRAGGGETATCRREGRDAQLIEFYQQYERGGDYFTQGSHVSPSLFSISVISEEISS